MKTLDKIYNIVYNISKGGRNGFEKNGIPVPKLCYFEIFKRGIKNYDRKSSRNIWMYGI